ncbi:MAG: hypothetical protein SCARUB_02151 [Candidatus Scalindua rubra]|uniref:DNA-binding protein n=1 Tax=Candidatus Scalindua rubra TaxID=1872076 RepID=A0A1E3XAQ1_9BACT|nr:MAG: hypothetical protein SCARUB_02151 [Candidatus Scalindua rubra]
MKKPVTILSFIFIFVATIFANYAYANSQYTLSNEDASASPSPQAQNPLLGTVAETMNSGDYTYILLQTKTKMFWIAIKETKVTVGQDIILAPGIEMKDFTSKSLNRTFDSIIFSEGLITQGGSAIGSAKPQMTTPGSKGAKPPSKENLKVDKATGENAYTVAELFEKRSELDNKEIVLRGEVVKATAQIMGKTGCIFKTVQGTHRKELMI